MPQKKRFRLGLETFSYHVAITSETMTLPRFVERTAELGLDGVQLNYGHTWKVRREEPDWPRKFRDITRALGLFVELDVRGTDPAHLTSMLRLCEEIGADVLRTYVSCGGDFAQELAQAPAHLRAVLPLCQELGIRIAVENH